MSLLFDALKRLQDNEGKLEGKKGSSPQQEPSGTVPLSINSAVFLQVPEVETGVGQAVVSATTRKSRRGLPLVSGVIGFLLLVAGSWIWFSMPAPIILEPQQTSTIKPTGVTVTASVPPPPQRQTTHPRRAPRRLLVQQLLLH